MWETPVLLALRRLGHENWKLKASLDYIGRPYYLLSQSVPVWKPALFWFTEVGEGRCYENLGSINSHPNACCFSMQSPSGASCPHSGLTKCWTSGTHYFSSAGVLCSFNSVKHLFPEAPLPSTFDFHSIILLADTFQKTAFCGKRFYSVPKLA